MGDYDFDPIFMCGLDIGTTKASGVIKIPEGI
jgi:hypothetical protein